MAKKPVFACERWKYKIYYEITAKNEFGPNYQASSLKPEAVFA